jgi:hypothetical protein
LNEYLNEESKNAILTKTKTNNRIGGFSKLGFSYSYQKEKNKPIVSFSFFDRSNLDIKFSKDLFAIIFFGNKSYEGKTAYMGSSNFSYLRYQQLSFGWKKENDTHSYGFSASLINGEQNVSANINKADLFTAEGGTFIDFSTTLAAHYAGKTNNHFFANNGMGASVDLYYQRSFKTGKRKSSLQFELMDVGFIRWNKKSIHYSSDTSYHYEGMYINDIFNSNTSAAPVNLEATINKHAAKSNQSYTTYLPAIATIRYHLVYTDRIMGETGIQYRFNSSAIPFCFLKLQYLIGSKKIIGLAYSAGYGDYGNFCSGLDVKINCKEKYVFRFSSHYLFSSLASKAPSGMGAGVQLIKRF